MLHNFWGDNLTTAAVAFVSCGKSNNGVGDPNGTGSTTGWR